MTHEELLKHVDERIKVGQAYKVLNIANPLCIIFKESEEKVMEFKNATTVGLTTFYNNINKSLEIDVSYIPERKHTMLSIDIPLNFEMIEALEKACGVQGLNIGVITEGLSICSVKEFLTTNTSKTLLSIALNNAKNDLSK